MNRILVGGIVLSAVGLVICLSVLIALSRPEGPDPLAPDESMDLLSIPAFTMSTPDGETVTRDVFRDRITIVDFIFTNCVAVCPFMSATMSDLAGQLADTDARFMSISVDPDHDTPERLGAYAQGLGADPKRWLFLRGDPETIRRILHGGLRFELEQDPSQANRIPLPDGSTMPNIIHPARLFLIGPDARVLGLYNYDDPDAVRALERRVKAIDARLKRGR